MNFFNKPKASKKKKEESSHRDQDKTYKNLRLTKDIEENITQIRNALNNSWDIRERKLTVGSVGIQAAVIFVTTLVNEEIIQESIVKPLMVEDSVIIKGSKEKVNLQVIKNSLVSTSTIEEADTFDEIILEVLSGSTVILFEGYAQGLLVGTQKLVGRSIGEPKMEPSVKGPKESFVENLQENLGLIRKRVKDPNLTFEAHKIGRRSKNDAIIIHIKGIAQEEMVKEVRNRMKRIDIDDGVSSYQVSHLISDNPNSIFPLIQITERPDKVIPALMEGRVGIVVEGTPDVILVPVSLPMLLQSVDDYYEKWIIGSIIRFTRYCAFFISALLPSLYIALTSFHPGILPTNIVLSIAGTRTGVPFPAFIEALLMTVILEILQEAGIRLPRVVGQTVSIVGGLVIGQAAVQAGVISPVMVIVIAITAISSFTLPDYSLNFATRVLRIPFLIIATMFGTVGTSIGLLALLGYVCSQESFGVGYLEPLTPYRIRDWKDSVLRGPQKIFGKRPEFLNPDDTQRQIIQKGDDDNESN